MILRARMLLVALCVFGAVVAIPKPAAADTLTVRALLAGVPVAAEAGSTTYS